jgi:hypothetical protein
MREFKTRMGWSGGQVVRLGADIALPEAVVGLRPINP